MAATVIDAGLAAATLSLTVLRMLPVALSLVSSGMRVVTVLFLGWSGPRGSATVVFALLAIESFRACGGWIEREQPALETRTSPEPQPRGTVLVRMRR